MTSAERKQARYLRRKAKRDRKRVELAKKYTDPNKVFSTQAIVRGYKKSSKTSKWKPSTQRFGANLFINARNESRRLLNGTWRPKGFYEFDIIERGKPRHIQSVHISEKSVQAAISNESLVPIISRYLIYDNGASLKEKGTDFQIKRLTEQLHWHFTKYGLNGGIYFYDFSSYFNTIPHIPLANKVYEKVLGNEVMRVYLLFLKAMTPDNTINLVTKGLGLGSQVFQISAVFYPNSIDHMLKDQVGLHCDGRYMDDGYFMHHSIKVLKHIVTRFENACKKEGIVLNRKKCRIIKFGKPFVFLKTRFFVTKTGAVIKRMHREGVAKERKKLRKLKEKLLAGKRIFKEVNLELYSWLCSRGRGKCYFVLKNMIEYFNNLFSGIGIFSPPPSKPRRKTRRLVKKIRYIARSLDRRTWLKNVTSSEILWLRA